MKRLAVVGTALVMLLSPVHAQWLNYPTPGVPRTPDGKVHLDAPVPRTADGRPDLSGIWASQCGVAGRDACFAPGSRFFDLARGLDPEDVQMTPWASAIQKQREARNHVDDPYGYCLPPGTPRINFRRAVQDHPDAASDRAPLRDTREQHLQAGLHGWAPVPGRHGVDVAWLLDRKSVV